MVKHGRGANRKSMQEGVGSLREFLTFLREDFPCRSIMTPWSRVLTVEGHGNTNDVKDAARVLMDEHALESPHAET